MDVTWLPDARPRERHLAVGEFDGVHVGHREVIRGADTVLTFEPHPRFVVAPESAPKLLTQLAIKADLIADLGVRELVVIPFDGSFAAQTAQEFIDRELIQRLGARTVVSPATAPRLLTSLETKADLIAGLGVRELVVIPFDGAFASQEPQEFIDHVLVGQLGAESGATTARGCGSKVSTVSAPRMTSRWPMCTPSNSPTARWRSRGRASGSQVTSISRGSLRRA